MKNKVKSAGIVALAAVLACGALGALAGCKKSGEGGNPKGDKNTLTVSIFCNAADATTNQKICDNWAAEYKAAHPELGDIKVELTANPDKGAYFTQLNKDWSTGDTAEIIYLAPKYVRSYVEKGNILDLTDYLTDDEKAKTQDVWQNGISYYGYIKGQATGANRYTMGQPIHYDSSSKKYVTDNGGSTVGLYGLPKDYSNFSTGYNRVFFSDALKKAYTTHKPIDVRDVSGAKGEGNGEFTSKLTGENAYKGEKNYQLDKKKAVARYACDVDDYDNPYTEEVEHLSFRKGDPANVITVGVPVTYYPYNFFRWPSFDAAFQGNDPVAVMSYAMDGYTVTLPGFPNDEFAITQAMMDGVYTGNPSLSTIKSQVPYNPEIGHITYTYAEYGALLWATTYYLNTFDWDAENPLAGQGGRDINGTNYAIYGGEQYEGIAGATGSVLYLLPWLAANDADLINDISTKTSQEPSSLEISDTKNWKASAGTKSYTAKKRTFANTEVDKAIQYGHDSQNFIETYAAFLAIGSDWNGNPSGDTESLTRDNNGWAYFRKGQSLFYGAGSWDAATRNDVDMRLLDFGQMPTPIAEKYALYSEIKDANYQKVKYSNDPAAAAAGSAAEANQRSDLAAGCTKYSLSEIRANQLRRQDKWAARMDSVGYAVAAKVVNYTGEHAWKKDASASLVAALTINEKEQKTLLYGGAQLPNFISQCKQFVNYKTAGENGSFSDMLTPEGFWNETAEVGKTTWDGYYALAREMAEKAKANSEETVASFLNGKKVNGVDVKYNTDYANYKFSQFTGDGNARLAYGMKILNMVAYRADDRDINIRMQYGLNAVRDSSMYTYRDTWMGSIDARGIQSMLAYLSQKPIEFTGNFLVLNATTGACTSDYVQMNPTDTSNNYKYMTPAVWCLKQAKAAQDLLQEAVLDEYNQMS